MLIELQSLAHEASSDKRRELLSRVTDMFLSGAEDHSNRESTLYADVVLQVLDQISVEDRVDYSQAIATEARIPGTVVKQLASDQFNVASPVLTHSPVLSEDDLVEIAETGSQDHLKAISNRPELSEMLTDTLIERGDGEVHRTVSANTGARFSTEGLTRLTESSAEDETVRSNILGRADLRQQLADTVLPLVSSEYAARLRGIIERADDQVIDEVVNSAESGVKAEQGQGARQRLELRSIMNELLAKTRKVDDVIVYLADQSRLGDIVTVFARLSGIPENVVSNVMFKANNEPVAILCRAVGATTIGFKAIQAMRQTKLRLPQSHLDQGMRDFSQLDEKTAKRSLRFVKVRSAVA